MITQEEIDQLDPGVRDLVVYLNSMDFETCDSGDGVSKPEMGCALPYLNVFVQCDPIFMIEEARRFHAALYTFLGSPVQQGQIDASFDPISGTAFLIYQQVDCSFQDDE